MNTASKLLLALLAAAPAAAQNDPADIVNNPAYMGVPGNVYNAMQDSATGLPKPAPRPEQDCSPLRETKSATAARQIDVWLSRLSDEGWREINARKAADCLLSKLSELEPLPRLKAPSEAIARWKSELDALRRLAPSDAAEAAALLARLETLRREKTALDAKVDASLQSALREAARKERQDGELDYVLRSAKTLQDLRTLDKTLATQSALLTALAGAAALSPR